MWSDQCCQVLRAEVRNGAAICWITNERKRLISSVIVGPLCLDQLLRFGSYSYPSPYYPLLNSPQSLGRSQTQRVPH